MSFSPQLSGFFGKIRNFLHVGRFRKFDEERGEFSGEKRFHDIKLHLYQIGKAQNMPKVAGRLVYNYDKWYVVQRVCDALVFAPFNCGIPLI